MTAIVLTRFGRLAIATDHAARLVAVGVFYTDDVKRGVDGKPLPVSQWYGIVERARGDGT